MITDYVVANKMLFATCCENVDAMLTMETKQKAEEVTVISNLRVAAPEIGSKTVTLQSLFLPPSPLGFRFRGLRNV
jgi:hypothetical protein